MAPYRTTPVARGEEGSASIVATPKRLNGTLIAAVIGGVLSFPAGWFLESLALPNSIAQGARDLIMYLAAALIFSAIWCVLKMVFLSVWLRLRLDDAGLHRERFGSRQTLRWSELARASVTYDLNTLTCSDRDSNRARLTFSPISKADGKAFIERIRTQLPGHLQREAARELRAGARIPVGRLQLALDGIFEAGRLVPWSDVATIDLDASEVRFVLRDSETIAALLSPSQRPTVLAISELVTLSAEHRPSRVRVEVREPKAQGSIDDEFDEEDMLDCAAVVRAETMARTQR